jgi:hypothetical protein
MESAAVTQASDERRERDPGQDKAWEPLYERVWVELNKRVTFAKASPPPGFDPLAATQGELELFKLPPRPDRTTNPRAYANWRRAMSPPLRFVLPEVLPGLVADLTKLFTISRTRRQHQFLSGLAPTQEVSGNWSGACVRNNPDEGYVLLQATWIVPRPYPPPPSASGGAWLVGDYFSSAWIGLDGHDPGSLSLPQIGTAHCVSVPKDTSNPGDLSVTVGAWWQWWLKDDPFNHPIDIPQSLFPVQPGDLIYAQLNVLNDSTVRFFLKNQSLGQVFPPFDLTPPTPSWPNPNHAVTVEGKTAEWIVERPTQPTTPDLLPFCDSGSVVFYDCNAQVAVSSPAGITLEDRQLQLARLIRLADWTPKKPGATYQPGMDQPGIIVSSAALEGDDAALVSYTGNSA